MAKVLYTIGYEAANLRDFIATLKKAGVEIVLDIRALPLSRRAGFSKTALGNALRDNGIDYLHLRGLGTPKAGRDANKEGDHERFEGIFENHMRSPEAVADLARATDIAAEKSACLLCVEKQHTQCHRALVAPRIVKANKQKIINLKVIETDSAQTDLLIA